MELETRVEVVARFLYLGVISEREAAENVRSPRWDFLRPEIKDAFRQAARDAMSALNPPNGGF